MNILNRLSDFLEHLDTKDFYKYIGAVLTTIALIFLFMIYRFFGSVGHYKREINFINIQREEIQALLEKAMLIKEQKRTINTMLEADSDFRIGGYFLKILEQLNLTQKSETSSVTTQERSEQGYNESILSAKFTDMNMKELAELLEVLEKNKRIYTKDLDIQLSKKTPGTLEVQLTIATLQPRSQQTESTE